MTPEEYYLLCLYYWDFGSDEKSPADWFKNMEMQKFFKADPDFKKSGLTFDKPNRRRGYVEDAEKVLAPAYIEVWKIGARNWTVKPGCGPAFKQAHPNAGKRIKKVITLNCKMNDEERALHIYLKLHVYPQVWRVSWHQLIYRIGYCAQCGGFYELRKNDEPYPLGMDEKLLRKIRSKLPRSLKRAFDSFFEYKRNCDGV